ncbi:MAG: lipoyl synthase [Verrucomicrobiota bacterium]
MSTCGGNTVLEASPAPVALPLRRRLPDWLKVPLPANSAFTKTRQLLEDLHLHTVCESAKCPNHWECWSRGTATFMIAGDRCTRACGFCAVSTAKPLALEDDEPRRVAEATRRMGLQHVVITAVARDDLADGGADHFHRTIAAVRELNPGIVVEVLTPDFLDRDHALDRVLAAEPDVFNHNLETVRRLTPSVRHRATYDRSLAVLRKAKERGRNGMLTKSGMMLGLGEAHDEVAQSLRDLRAARVDVLTLGQYLQPTLKHLPVAEYVAPAQFEAWRRMALELGFAHVSAGPLVRSSYHADDVSNRRDPATAGLPGFGRQQPSA